MSITGLARRIYTLGRGVTRGLPDDALDMDPMDLFGSWMHDAGRASLMEPTAMTLATCTAGAWPSARMVLLKGFDQRGFVFYTNYRSRKAADLDENPRAALVMHWQPLLRQVRVEGTVEKVAVEESRAYFRTRPRGSQIGAWASRQSTTLSSRAELKQRVKEFEDGLSGKEIPLPEFWGGYRVRPVVIEFWQGRANRLHDRVQFMRSAEGWKSTRLYP